MLKDTGHFVQIYQCNNCGSIFEEKDILSIRVHNVVKLKCPAEHCHSEQIKCIGDNAH